jgi:cysteine-rich repeat protein
MKFKIGVLVLLLILSMGFYSGYAVFGITPLQGASRGSSIPVGPAIPSYEWNPTNGTNQTCGNNLTEPGEECDDGNLINGDGCDQFCRIENGTNGTGGTYQCSDYLDNDIDLLVDYPADPGCTGPTDNDEWNGPICGNNLTEPGEECDDGNLINGDGCDQFCRIENGTNKSAGGGSGVGDSNPQIKESGEITGITFEEEDTFREADRQFKLSISSKGKKETALSILFFEEDFFMGGKLVEELQIKNYNFGGNSEYILNLRGLLDAKGSPWDKAKIIVEITTGHKENQKTYKSNIYKIDW